ncbi:MAG: SUMF1/EgtB/PvdO family nonheme iron enzyme [Actinobacteria bacterium]|nr:SUMF1/EgtB/PvdO family nonheme iron enzyme [Actinomycetota bacterium]
MAKRFLILPVVAIGLTAMLLAPSTAAANVTLDTVLVGDPGNAADPATGYGAVAKPFRISTYEVTIAQYVDFLNAVAAVPANDVIAGLYKEEMADLEGQEDPGSLIIRSGAGTKADPYVYKASRSAAWPNAAQRPIAWVTWFDAARFANWMHNGSRRGGTETGAYTLVDFQESGVAERNAKARFWIPSEDEWYKAAYYDPTKAGANKYWNFPTRSDKPPRSALVSDAALAPAANFQSVYTGSDAGVLTPVGSYAGSTSHYGTFDQSWGPGITPLSKTVRRDYGPMGGAPFYADDDAGFRLAGLAQP